MLQNLVRILQKTARRVLPLPVKYALSRCLKAQQACVLDRLLESYRRQPDGAMVSVQGFTVRITRGISMAVEYHDQFVQKIYHFSANRLDPRILDGGSHMGISILYFKSIYPAARITGFEPDPAIFGLLQENISTNQLDGVELVNAGLGTMAGTASFLPDGDQGGRVINADGTVKIRLVPLADYLAEPVDFLKLNIEGAEWDVLQVCEDRLRQVREMVIEYHHLPGLPRTLHNILTLLHRQRFDYLINDFDGATNGTVIPPFRLAPDSRYFLLIYAKRLD